MDFEIYPKMPRFGKNNCIITEKIDGTNGQILIGEDGQFQVGSRNRWITPENDNYGFATWCYAHKDELILLGPGRHFGEWWGKGIQRGYDVPLKMFSLFRSAKITPSCLDVVPTLFAGVFSMEIVEETLARLKEGGSEASPGFMNPEGIVVWCEANRQPFKHTFEGDKHKGETNGL